MSIIKLTEEMRDSSFPTEEERMVAEFVLLYIVAYYTQGDRDVVKVYRGKGGAIKELLANIFPDFMKNKDTNGNTQVDLIWKAEKDLCVEGILERYYFLKKKGKYTPTKLNLIPAFRDGEILTDVEGNTVMTFEKVAKSMYLQPAAGEQIRSLFVDEEGNFHDRVANLPDLIDMEELNRLVAEAYTKDVESKGSKKTYTRKSFWK